MSSITLTYADIISQVRKLSVFEGREKFGTSGESEFSKVLITDQDTALVTDYMHQAIDEMLKTLGRMVESVNRSAGTGEIWVLRNSGYDSEKYSSVLTRHLQEAACAYIMSKWLSNRIPERVEFYTNLYANMLHMAAQNIFSRTLKRPIYDD